MAKTRDSQIYHWGIKSDAVLDGGRPGATPNATGASSTASTTHIPQPEQSVNPSNPAMGAGIGDMGANPATTNQQKVDTAVADIMEQAKTQKAQTTSQQDMVDAMVRDATGAGVGDMGAKTSDFRHEVKESQTATNTIGKKEAYGVVPEDARTSTAYDAVTEEEGVRRLGPVQRLGKRQIVFLITGD